MAYDGAIRFNTRLDNSNIEKDLRDLERKIQKAEESISKNENEKMPLVKQVKELGGELDEAKYKAAKLKEEMLGIDKAMAGGDPMAYIEAAARKPQAAAELKAQEAEVARLQKQFDRLNDKVDRYDRNIKNAQATISRSSEKAAALTKQMNSAGTAMQGAFAKAKTAAAGFEKRVISIGKRVLVFALIAQAFRAIKDYMGKVLKTNDEYNKQLAKLKAALMTAFQPLYEAILPAIIAGMQMLVNLATLLANLLSTLFGKTVAESASAAEKLNQEASAMEELGKEAKKAKSNLAGFDEINIMSSTADTSASADSATTGEISPDFSWLEDANEQMDELLRTVLAIGIGLLSWKITNTFGGTLQQAAGAALMAGGAFEFAASWADAFSNGIDWENLTGLIAGLGAAVGGLALLFGTTGAAVGALVGGIAMVIVAIADFAKSGEMSTETLATLEVGLLAVGVAISVLTGSWIPALVAAIVGVVTAVVINGDEIKGYLQKLDDWLQNVFATDWTELFGPVLGGALNLLCDAAKNVWTGIKRILDGLIDFIGGVFTDDWRKAWNGLKEILSGIAGLLPDPIKKAISAVTTAVNGLVTFITGVFTCNWREAWDGVKSIFSAAINALPQSFKNAINGAITLFNQFISWVNDKMKIKWDGLKIGGKEIIKAGSFQLVNIPNIPYLAQGAVIPPNAPFMAMLGDQKHGTNVEAPLETIQEAVAVVMADMTGCMTAGFEATVGVLKEILEAVYGIEIGDDVIGQAVARYNSKMAIIKGGNA